MKQKYLFNQVINLIKTFNFFKNSLNEKIFNYVFYYILSSNVYKIIYMQTVFKI